MIARMWRGWVRTEQANAYVAYITGTGAPFRWKTLPDIRVLIAEDLGAAPTPLVLAQVECYTRRSAASRHPSRWRGAATSM